MTEEAAGGGPIDDITDWCRVEPIVQSKCQRCHADPPQHGAPFSLVTYEDTQLVSASGKSRLAAIERAIEQERMPASFIELEPPVEPLEPAEKDLLLEWCRSGAAPAPDDGCP